MRFNSLLKYFSALTFLLSGVVFAAGASTFGGMASTLNDQFTAIGNLMLNTAYIAGLGFGIAAIFKFKQHKDNPTQVPIGTPFALLAVSVLLVFLPGLYKPAAQSLYGTSTGVAAGTSGKGISLMPGGST